jgi:hypothetical protein
MQERHDTASLHHASAAQVLPKLGQLDKGGRQTGNEHNAAQSIVSHPLGIPQAGNKPLLWLLGV